MSYKGNGGGAERAARDLREHRKKWAHLAGDNGVDTRQRQRARALGQWKAFRAEAAKRAVDLRRAENRG